jgi:hypothetical protein
VCAAASIWIGARLGLPTRAFATLNVLLALATFGDHEGHHTLTLTSISP